ncbi:hypothetical protein EIN_228330 [Entamoeba invadens IP1]|uniref:Uncharacterized protein n=1 Tax=Entamoeba invadens IP1 TaxID=370355 RepID=A0A0A1U656_ENTIV|nr:hypothetical protein EIN_228330 [Entamoeba invadens IP1]ELP88370.1 hypothetical protein EIN_228330 [Entamoeba invadens IP1]|eukprot:XP_004255141.1 hypothetical protein EIN_228330 [Entamoeba invadens IP1]
MYRVVLVLVLIGTVRSYDPLFEEVNCTEFTNNCRECVRYVKDYKDIRRGCSWCTMPNYFDSYCYNPNTTSCKGTLEDVCQMDPMIMSVVSVLCLLPLLIVMIFLILPSLIKCIKKIKRSKLD